MSLILDALKRAQEDRQPSDATSGTTGIVQSTLVTTTHNSSHKLLWLIVLLLLAILILLWFLLKKSDVAVVVPVVPTVERPVAPVNETRQSSTSSIAPQPSVASSVIGELYQEAKSSLPSIKDVQIAQLYVETSTESSIAMVDINESISVVNPLPDTNRHLPETMQVTTQIRRLENLEDTITFEDLSLTQKQQFPSINYSQHNYLGNSASSVVINGQLMRAGSSIGDARIIEILEDGIVLNFNGRRVSFKALNSWINM